MPSKLALRVLLSAAILLTAHYAGKATATPNDPGTFATTGNMATGRHGHTATLLADGKVLIAGGAGTVSAELYDPAAGTFVPTGNMSRTRYMHTATLLHDGKVLIAGGRGEDVGVQASCEIYDPATGTFTMAGDMTTARFCHTATLLNTGKVLIAGGQTKGYLRTAGAELYDPSTSVFTDAGAYADILKPTVAGLLAPSATLLADGRVLIAGANPAQLYDPRTATFGLTGAMATPLYKLGMYWHTSTLLKTGNVLVAGGSDDIDSLGGAEIYDPTVGRFVDAGTMVVARALHSATLLTDGTVLIAGGGPGWYLRDTDNSAELYDPETGSFRFTGNMRERRAGHTATLLENGTVLITGGFQFWDYLVLSSAEVYAPQFPVPVPAVTGLQFDRAYVDEGTSYLTNILGSNLGQETLFDVRYSAPGSNEYDVVLNWQKGVSASHTVPAGTALGTWTINGVRAHRDELDHTGVFTPVRVTISVSP